MEGDKTRTEIYPEIEPYDTGMLEVSTIHTLYYEQCGNKDGNPVLFLHGGPGGATSPKDRRFFDPSVYRAVLFHQRGCGQSTPFAELRENETKDLIEDIEKLRKYLGVDKWILFGGSWGSTLALAYAQAHPEHVKAMIIRGIYILRRAELEWLYEGKGAQMIYPDHWENYVNFIPEGERQSMLNAYYRRLTSYDEALKCEAAKRFISWDLALYYLNKVESLEKVENDPKWTMQSARLQCHYYINGGFLAESQLLDNVDKIRHIPAAIVHGRYDMMCPMDTAWQLHKRWPEAEFVVAPTSGHTAWETEINTELVRLCEKYKNLY